MPSPEQLFADALRSDPSRPFVTYYDEQTGERSELSMRSLANWVAKTHHLISDDLGLGVDDRALLALPPHWISLPVVLGCLSAGLELTDDAPADVAFVEPDTAAAADGIPDVFVIAPSSAAVGLRGDMPAGAQDFVLAVRPQPDVWAGVQFGAGPADAGHDGLSRATLVTQAGDRAATLGIGSGARVLSTSADWLQDVFLVLAVGGSLVYVVNSDDAALLDRRAEQERVTNRT